MGGSSSGKGVSDWIGASFDPLGSIFGDSLGFDVDPIGNMIGQSMANVTGMVTGEKKWDDVQQNFFGSNWIGDIANPWVGGKSRQQLQQEETNRMYYEQLFTGTYTPANEDLWKPFRSKTESKDTDKKKIPIEKFKKSIDEEGESLLGVE